MATTDTELQQLVINVGTEAQIEAGIASGTITSDMLSIATDGADITYDWVGTLAEYNEQNVATNHPDWLCFITDDVNNSGEDVYNNVYSKTTADEIFVAKTDNLPQYLPNLLEYRHTDHLLNNVSWLRADTFSWQSGEIYEAVYDHLVEDMTGATQKQAYLKHNAVLSGNARVSMNGLLGSFDSSTSYGSCINIPTSFTSFELGLKVKMPTTISSNDIIGTTAGGAGIVWRFDGTTLKAWMGSGGGSWDISSAYTLSYTFQSNTIYWLKLAWDGTTYTFYISTDSINYSVIGTVASTVRLGWNGTFHLGGSNWETYNLADGYIDLNETYLKINNALYWKGVTTLTYYEATDKHCIVLPDQLNNIEYLYTNTNNAWYYILDQENQRFKLPRKNTRNLIAQGTVDDKGSWYKLYSDGWVEQGSRYTGTIDGVTWFSLIVPMRDTNYVAEISHTRMPTSSGDPGTSGFDRRAFVTNNYRPNAFAAWGLWSTILAYWKVYGYSDIDTSKYKDVDKYLYFYVGEFTQDAIINTAGITTEELNAKADADAVVAKGHEVIEFQAPTADNNYKWYRKYADGWVEQGGVYDRGSVATNWNTVITLPVMMQNTNYTAIVSAQWMDGDHLGENGINVEEKTTSSFKIYFYTGASGDGVRAACWEVKGMYAQ